MKGVIYCYFFNEKKFFTFGKRCVKMHFVRFLGDGVNKLCPFTAFHLALSGLSGKYYYEVKTNDTGRKAGYNGRIRYS